MNRNEKNQTHFDSKHRKENDLTINYASDLYIDEENDNEVENYNQGKELSILIRNDYNININNNNNDTIIRINREENRNNLDDIQYLDENESEEYLSQKDDEDDADIVQDQSFPFPKPTTNTLTRTDLAIKTDVPQDKRVLSPNWLKLKTKMENLKQTESESSPAKAWSTVRKMIKTAPSNTKLFLGIDSSNNVPISLAGNDIVRGSGSQGPVNRSGLGGGGASRLGRSGSGLTSVDSGRGPGKRGRINADVSTTSATPIPIYKTLNNWNERTFGILNSNMIFGGKIKEKALDNYLENLNEDAVDMTDPFLHYKTTGSQIDASKRRSVANLAMNGVKKILKNRKPPSTSHLKKLDPGRDFEQPFINQQEEDGEPKRLVYSVQPPASERDDVDNGNEESANKKEKDNEDGPWDAFTHAFSEKRIFGVGFCGRFCDNFFDPNKKHKYEDLLSSIKQHRPYFTYWVTFVQVIICFVSLIAYGVAPIGFSYTIKKGLATTINLEKQFISYPVKQNFWIGPAAMDLVHLGAKYAPCMRNDSNIYKAIQLDRDKERESACCIRNDRGGCVQTNKGKCSELFSRFDKWNASTHEPGPGHIKRSSGSVCGLDPEFCSDIDSNKWPDDITKWPKCEKPTAIFNSSIKENEHMYCEVIGRPCCIGIQGECIVTTNEHCSLMRGFFHESANLCSQVDCMQDVCGMIDFLNIESPDQVYRLFTSIFIHAGIIQLLFTVFFQIFILRDVEKLAGCLRVAIIYTASGVIGNLGSAIFLPYQAEVGPLGAQFGIIACTFVEMFHAWEVYKNPWLVLSKMVGFLIILILIGFFPMIDNFANVFGFISGLLLGSILFPNINLNGKCKRVLMVAVSISIIVVVVAALVVLFYIKPIDKCDWCKKLSCPFSSKYCLEFDFNITRIN